MEQVWYTLLGTSKQHRMCGYIVIVISDMMFYDFIGICFLILGGKPIGFYLQEHRLYLILFPNLIVFVLFFLFLGFCYLEMVLEECYVIIGFFVFVRWFEMSAVTLYSVWECSIGVHWPVKNGACDKCWGLDLVWQIKWKIKVIKITQTHQSLTRIDVAVHYLNFLSISIRI